MSPQAIAAILRSARRAKHMTQTQLGEKVGVHYNTISRFEQNTFAIGLSTLEAIANSLGYELVLREIKHDR